jgi:methionyl-tRNA formyltransferase
MPDSAVTKVSRLKVAFAGTPEFARVALASLRAAGFDVVLVLTQPDRPAGRGMQLQASPVKVHALGCGIPVEQPRSLRLDGKFAQDAGAARQRLVEVRPDVLVVAAYGLILPGWVLELPRLGCLNIHASLLPRWRGAAPIHRAIEAGDAQTGITIMQMDAGLDTGATLLAEPVPINADDTTGTLHDRLAVLGGRLIVEALELAACGGLKATPQPAEGVTYAPKIEKSEAAIDWRLPAAVIERRVRAFDPFPGANTELGALILKCWRVEPCAYAVPAAVPGDVLAVDDAGVVVACGDGALRLTELQRPGGKRMLTRQFLQGTPLQVGMRLGSDPA